MADVLFEPLRFRNLTVRNRLFRSNIAGRFDDYDGSGSQTRINWELKFAQGGVGAIVSSWCGVDPRGFIVPGYASIDRDDTIPFWRELGRRVREHDCRYILQLAYGGRQRDIQGITYPKGLSSTDKPDPLHGFQAECATPEQLHEISRRFAAGARRAREAGLDGVEIHGANGYVFTQFLSSAINDRDDEYGGSLENRARFLLETIRAIRTEVGDDYHLQVKLSTTEYANAFLPWLKPGNTIEDSVQVAHWIEQAGADAIHVSAGSTFPHPVNPAGDLPLKTVLSTYDGMISNGVHAFRNYVLYRTPLIGQLMSKRWSRQADTVEAFNLPDARRVKNVVSVPVLVTGGFQTASVIRDAIERGNCDAVTMGRTLVANNDLPKLFAAGHDRAPRPCTFCNKCLFNVIENPLGCYDERRYDSREAMVAEIMSVYDPPPYVAAGAAETEPAVTR
jgi:2,4-dienoyl-CoA reductase-like NADH-dependent reductase (Old Yellow Enzyme family)